MIIWSFINCPTIICLIAVCYFSREKPLVKPTAPGSVSHIICLCDLFYLPFIFRSIKPKIQKYLAAIYFIWRSIYQYLQLSHVRLPISGTATRKGSTTPFTRRVVSICYLCAGAVLCCVAWFSYWFDNLGFISEGNTSRRCAASFLPLWGNTDIASSDINVISSAIAGEDLQHIPGS